MAPPCSAALRVGNNNSICQLTSYHRMFSGIRRPIGSVGLGNTHGRRLRATVFLTAGILLRGPERSEGHVSRNDRVRLLCW
jgi:hypothetical protein